MGHPIDDHFDVQTTADQLAATRADFRNAQALADKLQTLLVSKTHEAEALRAEIERMRHVEIHAMGLTFAVDTHEASEALTKLQELGGCVVVEAAR